MVSLQDIKNNFFAEADELSNYAEYIEAVFLSNTRFPVDILEKDDYERVNKLLENLRFSNDPDTESNNQIILNEVIKILDAQTKRNEEYIESHPLKIIPKEIQNSDIVKTHEELLEYLSDCELSEYTPESLKEEIDAVPDSEPYYGNLTTEDYSIYLQYAEIVFFNKETK